MTTETVGQKIFNSLACNGETQDWNVADWFQITKWRQERINTRVAGEKLSNVCWALSPSSQDQILHPKHNITQLTKMKSKLHYDMERSHFSYPDEIHSVFPCSHLGDRIKRLCPDDKIVDLDMHMAVLLVWLWKERSMMLWEKGQWSCRQQLCSSNYDQAWTEDTPAYCKMAK